MCDVPSCRAFAGSMSAAVARHRCKEAANRQRLSPSPCTPLFHSVCALGLAGGWGRGFVWDFLQHVTPD